jgi:uncharacterized membrane protein YfcA
VTGALIAGLAAVAVGAFVQSATGFGFALFSAPVLVATMGPRLAVPAITVLGLVVSALTLGAEGRRPLVLWRPALIMSAAAIPGMVVGALALAKGPVDALRALVSAAVLVAVAVQARTEMRPPQARTGTAPGWEGAVGAGAIAGVLSTSTGINGPPLILYLLRLRAGARRIRDTMAFLFVVTGLGTFAALGAFGALHFTSRLAWLVLAAIAGQWLGRRAVGPLEAHHRPVVLVVLVLTGVVGLVPVIQVVT